MKSENRVTLICSCIITRCLCESPLDLWLSELLPYSTPRPGGPRKFSWGAFSTPQGVSAHCCVTPLPTHILSRVTQGISLAQLQRVLTVRPPTISVLIPSTSKTPRCQHCQIPLSEPLGILTAPDIVTLIEALGFYMLKPSVCWSHIFFPCHRICPYCAPLSRKYQSSVARHF